MSTDLMQRLQTLSQKDKETKHIDSIPEANDDLFNRLKSLSKTQESSALNEYVSRPAQVVAESAVSGFRSLPRTSFDLLTSLVEKTGGSLKRLKELKKTSPDWLKKTMSYAFPTFEKSQEQLQSLGLAKPQGSLEGILEKSGRFLGEAPYLGGVGGVRGLASIGGASTALQIGEDIELPSWAKASLAIGGSYFGHKLGGVKKGELFRQNITPEVEKYIEASKEAGIDPLLTGMNPTQLQKVAQKWGTHGIGGPQLLKNAYESRSAQVSKAFEKALDETGENLYLSSFEAGEGLKDSIKEATRQVEMNKTQLYRAVDKTLPENATIAVKNPSHLAETLNKSIELLNDTLLASPQQGSSLGRLRTLRDSLEQVIQHGPAIIPVRRLEATNRALNDIIKYEKPGGYDKMLVPSAVEVRRLLEDYARTNIPYQTARKAANEYFANDVVHIRQNLLQSIARSERPESTLAIMNTVSGVRNVERALNSLPNGKTLTNSLKRYKLNSMIHDKIIDQSTGIMKVGGLKNLLGRSTKDAELIKELAGKEGYASLKNLETAGKGLEQGFNNLVNPSKTADTLIAINSIVNPGKKITSGIMKFFKANLGEGSLDVLNGLAHVIAPRIVAKITLDPAFARKVYALTNQAKMRHWRAFNKTLDVIDNEIKKEK